MLITRTETTRERDNALRQRPFWMKIMHSEHQSKDNSYLTASWTDWLGGDNYQKVILRYRLKHFELICSGGRTVNPE